MKIAETIYTHFQRVFFFICSDQVLQLSEYNQTCNKRSPLG